MKSVTRQFAIAILGIVQFCGAYAAEIAEQTTTSGTNSDVEKTIMVLFSPAETSGTIGSSRLTNYRNRTGYYTSGKDRRLSEAVSNDYRLNLVTDWPITALDLVCAVISIPDDRSVEEVIALLEKDDRLQLVQKMQTFEAMMNNDPYYALQVKQYSMDLEKLHQVTTGKKVSIAVIDTGVDLEHVDLAGQFAFSKNFAEDYSTDFSGDRHGTAIAGIIAAKNHNNEGIVGIAPDAKLLALKACWPVAVGNLESACNTLTLALALNRAMMEKVSIINMSLAGPEDKIIGLLLKMAIEKGILVVAADAAKPEGDRFPASMAGVLAVSSISVIQSDETKSLVIMEKSPAEPDAMITAPGISILAPAPGNSYDFFSGNSFAAAHVSGFAALLMQHCGKRDRHSLEKNLQAISRHLQVGDQVESLTCHASEGLH
jgi:subtilisin family serine protease